MLRTPISGTKMVVPLSSMLISNELSGACKQHPREEPLRYNHSVLAILIQLATVGLRELTFSCYRRFQFLSHLNKFGNIEMLRMRCLVLRLTLVNFFLIPSHNGVGGN